MPTYNDLKEVFPNVEELLSKEIINIIPIKENDPEKKPDVKTWTPYQNETIDLKELKSRTMNYATILGFKKDSKDYWLCSLDFDGVKISEKEIKKSNTLSKEEKKTLRNIPVKEREKIRLKTRKDLFNLLKGLKDVIVVKTANEGFHIYYWSCKNKEIEDKEDKFLKNIYYPKDYPIKFLQNKPVNHINKQIEHYTNKRYFLIPPSTIKQKNGKITSYDYFSSQEALLEFYENPKPKENILNEIKEEVQKNTTGYTHKEPESIEQPVTSKNNKKSSKENTSFNISSGLVKSKIYNPEIRPKLLNKMVESGYVQSNRNNIGYIFICNFRRHGLTEKEILKIFKDLKVPNHDLKKVKSWIRDKFKIKLESIDFKKYAGFNALQKEIRALNTPEKAEKLIEWFQNFFYDVFSNLKNNPESRKDLINLAEFVEKEYNIFKTLDKRKNPVYYYLNTKLNTFNTLNYHELAIKVFKDFGLRLPDTKFKTVLESCQKYKNIQNQFIEFKNVYINTKTLEIYSKERYSFLTNKKFMIELENNKKHFLKYAPDVKLFNTTENETSIEKEIKKILIPKLNQEDHNCYIDWLQRLGACISLNHKVISGYLGGGYNGKTVLNILSSEIFNNMYSGIEPEIFKKDFKGKAFENKHIVAIDELDNFSFISIIPHVKRFRGGGVPISERGMYKPDYYTNKEYGMLWLFSNYVPSIPLNEVALFRSMDIITLPNIFVDENELDKYPNGYLIERKITDRLKTDTKGLEWLINIAIKQYKKILENGKSFELSQTADETIAIITKNDYYLNFIALYLELDEYNQIKMKEIRERFKEWIKEQNYNITLPNDTEIGKEIGRKLKDFFPNEEFKGKNTGNYRHYKIRIKNKKEVDKRPYEINEDILYDNPYLLDNIETTEKRIYNAIKDGFNTYPSLNKEFPDINLVETLNNLINMNLIFQNSQTEIKSYG